MNIIFINRQKNCLELNQIYDIKNIIIYTKNDLFNICYKNKSFHWHENSYIARKIIIKTIQNLEIKILNSIIFIKNKSKKILILSKE